MKLQVSAHQILFRTFIIVTLVLMVILIIRLTPFPDLDAPEEPCDRPCHELEWPRICRLKFILESYSVPRRRCNNSTNHCLKEEFEYETQNTLLTVNRRITGPTIHVCVHDILVVDIINRIPDRSVSIHWRGLMHKNNPLVDGVPMVTQCPVISYTTFQYKFRASDVGTHMWHLQNDETILNANIYGMLVIREPVRKEIHSDLIDYDDSNHAIVLRGMKSIHNSAILINGNHPKAKINNETAVKFNVYKNRRYRFRIAHSGGNIHCAILGSIEGHKLIIIALDGNSIEPVYVSEFTIVMGERLDFVLWTNKDEGEYEMKFSFTEQCTTKSVSFAKITYIKEKLPLRMKNVDYNMQFQMASKLSTLFEKNCGESIFCLENVKSLSIIPEKVLTKNVDNLFYLFYGYQSVRLKNLEGSFNIAHINNITFEYPSSPLASQINDVPDNVICNENNLPDTCFSQQSSICRCTHVINVEIGSVVELVLVHQERNPTRDHTFHLHGHKFYVLGRQNNIPELSINDIKKWDSERNFVKRNFKKPVLKDTISIPRNGLAILRFVASNAGYWLFKEERSHGMELVFYVFGSQYEIPDSFPRCGNYVGPKYFLA